MSDSEPQAESLPFVDPAPPVAGTDPVTGDAEIVAVVPKKTRKPRSRVSAETKALQRECGRKYRPPATLAVVAAIESGELDRDADVREFYPIAARGLIHRLTNPKCTANPAVRAIYQALYDHMQSAIAGARLVASLEPAKSPKLVELEELHERFVQSSHGSNPSQTFWSLLQESTGIDASRDRERIDEQDLAPLVTAGRLMVSLLKRTRESARK